MVREATAGIALLAAVGECASSRPAAALRRGSACWCRPRCSGRAGRMEAPQIGHAQGGDQITVLTEGAGLAGPARLGRQVEARVQRGADPDRDVLLTGDVRERGDQAFVAQRREPERFGPLGEAAGGEGGSRVLQNACRGSVETVIGMPCGVCSAGAWRALYQPAAARGESRACTLKWLGCLPWTTVAVADLLIFPGVRRRVPSGPASITVWNISPTFSSRDSRSSRSSTRSATGSRGSSKGSIRPFRFRSR